ncbi:hypothetical protein CHAN_09445 [Corynebacterium hansenii]|nr:hypothetical protein CHAN_09445 [Corynebacterium hansenii]
MTTLQIELDRRRRAAPRLEPLGHGPRDPWAEQPPPPPPAPQIIAAVIGATGCGSIYDLDTLRAAYMATTDPHERAAIDAAARALIYRDEVPAA